jgi:CDP-diacylglycerol---glycerol-3-phosphate 3-phosphatidyltransferase
MPKRRTPFTTAANLLTLSRMLIIPPIVGLLAYGAIWSDFLAASLFGIAGLTDFLDGYFARKQKNISVYGQLMDPLADKLLVLSCLIALLARAQLSQWIVLLFLFRELAITGLRTLASFEGIVISASSGGKWKTGLQMGALPALMLSPSIPFPIWDITARMVLYASLWVSYTSGLTYAKTFLKKVS